MSAAADPPGRQRLRTFAAFYPFYASQHRRLGTRLLHVLGTSAVLLDVGLALALRRPRLLLLAPLLGYGPAWLSHLLCERNRPATFRYPLWSLAADFKMFLGIITGKERLAPE
ncbi:hypothetical protein TSOC_010354 [Tetrabaena socialis]|uniref:DUF962 domain-containing protein n=1 Tax=Tetrabaena socialis TaxID=47790 RepID=A0A2J7ZTI5_9CHLO|nr:hypothetical protein TSOC_010354 [Tetrabaena socialis]|eukprot:PNH03579.1 hypothetical protein TSOC_010354 [Tetrabaena socialis]